MQGLQIWVNLPKQDKKAKPRYQHIYKDEIPEDGLLFETLPEETIEQVIKKIRSKARMEQLKDFKLLIISILITLFLIFLFVNKVEAELKF